MAEKKRVMEEKARETLKGREWTVKITPRDGKPTGETDVFAFGDGTMESKNLTPKGYPVSNMTITVANDGAIVWETMKTAAGNDKAFFRGELRGGVMAGTMVMKSSKGKVATFLFSSGAAPAPVVAQEEEPVKKTRK